MHYSVKLLLWHKRPSAAGHMPIYLKITIDRDERYISTGHYIPPDLWDDKNQQVRPGHLQAATINADITSRKARAMQLIAACQLKNEVITAAAVKQQLTARGGANNIFDFIDQLRKNLAGKRGLATLENYRKYADNLLLFHGSRELTFEQITPDYLQRYENHLRGQGLSGNYIHAIWTGLRTFFNAARRKGLVKHYPFDQYDNPQYRAPGKEYLTENEIKLLKKYYLITKIHSYKKIISWFLFGCYSGLRISDWFVFDIKKNIVGEEIRIRATKNNEPIAIPISGGIRWCLTEIKDNPLTIAEPQINRELKKISSLSGINKSISTHCARHTFAVTMCAEKGLPLETCAALMGITVQTCYENYYRVTPMKIRRECLKAWKTT